MEGEFRHIKFMEDHDLTIDDLPNHIKYQVAGFNGYYAAYDDISFEDSKEAGTVKRELKELDWQILQELEEEFDELLEIPGINVGKKVSKEVLGNEELLLDELVKRGRTRNIGRSELRDMGMETRIRNATVIGKYILKKESMFYHRYSIIPLKEE